MNLLFRHFKFFRSFLNHSYLVKKKLFFSINFGQLKILIKVFLKSILYFLNIESMTSLSKIQNLDIVLKPSRVA